MVKHPAGAAVSTVYGKFYAHPEVGEMGCAGCVGEHSGVCMHLPTGCSDEPRIIWRREPYKAPKESLSVDSTPSPSKLYKPTHGGYPG